MTYIPTTFVNDTTPAINETELNKIGTGIQQAHQFLDKFTDPTGVTPTAGFLWVADGSTFVARALLATDMPDALKEDVTGTTYTLVLGDRNKLKVTTNAAAVTVTVPPNSSVAFPRGTVVGFTQYGAGQITFVGGAGVTLLSRGSAFKSAGQYAENITLRKSSATDEWILGGDIAV